MKQQPYTCVLRPIACCTLPAASPPPLPVSRSARWPSPLPGPYAAGLLALGDFHGVSTQRPYAAAAAGSSSSSSGEAPSDGQEATAAAAAAAATAAAAAAEGKQQQMQAAYNPHGPAGGQDVPDLQLAAELALTCYELYRRTPTGLAPEIAHFANNTGGWVPAGWVMAWSLPLGPRRRARGGVGRRLHTISTTPQTKHPTEGPLDFPNKHVHDVGHGDFTIKPKVCGSLGGCSGRAAAVRLSVRGGRRVQATPTAPAAHLDHPCSPGSTTHPPTCPSLPCRTRTACCARRLSSPSTCCGRPQGTLSTSSGPGRLVGGWLAGLFPSCLRSCCAVAMGGWPFSVMVQ